MIVGDLSPADFRTAMRAGLPIRTGPVLTHLRVAVPEILPAVQGLYRDCSVELGAAFSDFRVRLAGVGGLRKFMPGAAQVQFYSDGHAPFKPFPRRLALPMLEWGLNWCLASHAHQYLVLHAAVLARGDAAAILPAPPGSGKSTLCAALILRGWRLLSDELTLLDPLTLAVTPLVRPVSLKDGSIDLIRAFAPDAWLGPPSKDTHKGTVAHLRPPADSMAQAQQPATPRWIIFPQYRAGAAPVLAMMDKTDAAMDLFRNAFNASVLGERAFDAVTNLVDRCACHRFTYSRLDDGITTFASL